MSDRSLKEIRPLLQKLGFKDRVNCSIKFFEFPPEFVLEVKVRQSVRAECQRCVSFVFIVLTGEQWDDCAPI